MVRIHGVLMLPIGYAEELMSVLAARGAWILRVVSAWMAMPPRAVSGARSHGVWISALGVVEAKHNRRKLEMPEAVAQEGGFLTACETIVLGRSLDLSDRRCVVSYDP